LIFINPGPHAWIGNRISLLLFNPTEDRVIKGGHYGIDLAYAMGTQPGGVEAQGLKFGVFCPLSFIFVIFYFLLIRPQQKQKKEHQNLLSNLREGDNVLTAGESTGRVNWHQG